jgi:hypothetical protein
MFIRTFIRTFIRKCSLRFYHNYIFHHSHIFHPNHTMFLYSGGSLLLINANLSCHDQLQIHAHARAARLTLRNNNVRFSKNVTQQPTSKLSEPVWLNKLD